MPVVVPLSDRFKESVKVALAMAITYAIALSMGWEKPFWAGLSVAFCSLATTGESINRGVHRIVGTLLAGVFTAMIVALFPQDRWPFLLAMSVFIAFCTYRVTAGSRYTFIWFNAGFNVPILAMLGEGLALNSFDMIILRGQETALGVVVYSLVALLVWPVRGAAGFESTVRGICDAQHQLFRRYFGLLNGTPDNGEAERLRTQLTGQLGGLGGRLEGAVYDSDAIWAARHAWRRCIGELGVLNREMEHWRLGFPELKDLDLQGLMPGLPASGAELENRLAAIEGMLAGRPPTAQTGSIDLRIDPDKLDRLSHFQRAAAQLCRDRLKRIDELTRALFGSVSDIQGYGSPTAPAPVTRPASAWGVIDLDRLAGTVRQSATLWLTLLVIIFVPAFPNPVGVVALANAFAMILSVVPHVPAGVLLVPTVLGAVFAGALYILVMPHLSGFGELGVMIFLATFLIVYVFHRPQDILVKSMGLAMLVIVLGAESHQTYTVLYPANWLIAGIFFVLALMAAWRFPISFRPERRFLALLDRFFRSAEFLLSASPWDDNRKDSWWFRRRRAFHLHQLTALPPRLRVWGAALPSAVLGDTTTKDQVQSLTTSLQALSDRMQALVEVWQTAAKPAGILARELAEDMRAWRTGLQEALGRLSTDPGSLDVDAAGARLGARIEGLEARVEGALGKADETSVPAEVVENMYRLLGAYRGLSEALVELVEGVSPIDWERLREARL